jgi:hypothetical protein
MKTIRIDRLNLKCRGIPPATAQAAARELAPALLRHLGNEAFGGTDDANGSTTLRVPARIAPLPLANTIAGRVSAAIHDGAKPPGSNHSIF